MPYLPGDPGGEAFRQDGMPSEASHRLARASHTSLSKAAASPRASRSSLERRAREICATAVPVIAEVLADM